MATPKKVIPTVTAKEKMTIPQWVLPLSSLYTSEGLLEAAKWFRAGGDLRHCPFESPEQTETIAIRFMQAKFGFSADEVRKNIDAILFALQEEVTLKSEVEKKLKTTAYVPAPYLLKQWERDARKQQLIEKGINEFVKYQTQNWIARVYQLYQPRNQKKLAKACQQEEKEISQLFTRRLKVIDENLWDLRGDVAKIISRTFPNSTVYQQREILDLVYKDLELGFLKAESPRVFLRSLQTSIANSYPIAIERNLPTGYSLSFERASQMVYPAKKLATAASKAEEVNKSREVIERVLRTVIPALPPEKVLPQITPVETEPEKMSEKEATPVFNELPPLKWQFPEIEISLPEKLLLFTGQVTPEALIKARGVIVDVASTVLKKQTLTEEYPVAISEEKLVLEGVFLKPPTLVAKPEIKAAWQRKPIPAVFEPFQRTIESVRSLINKARGIKEKPIVELPKEIVFPEKKVSLKEAEEGLLTALGERLQLTKEELTVKLAKNIVTISLNSLNRPKSAASFPQRFIASAQKTIFFPIVKPLQLLINLSSDNFQRANPEIFYLFKYGLIPEEIDQKIVQLRSINRQHPQLPFWQNLKDRLIVFEENHPRFSFIFRRYFQSNQLRYQRFGQTAGIVRPRVSRFWRFITRGRFNNFSDIKSGFWRFFKKTSLGKWLEKISSKILIKLGLGAVSLGIIPVIAAGWTTFKKIGKLALAAIAAIFLWAAHYGSMALGGALAGFLAGIPLGIKAGASVAGALAASGVGLIIAIPAGIVVGFVVLVGTTLIGVGVGVALQMLIDKVSAGLSNVSIPGTLAGWLNKATAAVPNIATPAVGGTVATAFLGVYLVSQITSSAFIGEEAISSPYIEVTKTVTFSGQIGDPINYRIQVRAVDKNLTNVTINDQATAICKNTPPLLTPHNWDGNITIDSGSTWEQSYTVSTNSQFNDCLISNTVRVVAIVDGSTQSSFSVGRVSIGNPPVVIPNGLPVHDNPQRGEGYTYNQITEEGTVHKGIDVHGSLGCLVYSTFPSESTVIDVGYGARNGYYIIFNSGAYQIFVGHLAQRPSFNVNDKIGSLAPVGVQGNTGYSSAEHVHYMIWENGVVVDPRNFGVPSPPW